MSFSRTIFSKIPIVELASPAVQQLRQSQCNNCKFFQSQTGSCGPIVVGKNIDHLGENVHLCGCITSEKTEIKNQHCPIKKW